MGILFQVIATLLLCFSSMNMGILTAFPSSTILLYQSANTTLNRPMRQIEIALFGSLPAIGSLAAHPVAGMILDRLGRKRTAIVSSSIFVISWSIIALATTVEVVLTAMVIAGCGCTIFLVVTIYTSEIVQVSIRGTMTAAPNLFYGFGILVSYFLGGALGYYALVYTCLALAVIGVLINSMLKESPITLMTLGKEEEAAKSIAFYRRISSKSTEVAMELDNIKRSLKSRSEDARLLSRNNVEEEEDKEIAPKSKKMSCWQIFKTTPATRSQLYLVLVLKLAYICQGIPLVQVYAEPMFTSTVGDIMSPNLCSVVMGLIVFVSGVLAAYLTDVVGRRPLQIYSSIVSGICCFIIGIQIQTEFFPKWSVLMFIYIFASFHTLGPGTVAFVILAEVFLPEVKSILSMLAVEWSWTCIFLFLFLFNITMQSVGLSPIFFFFSFICFSTSVYFFYHLPETKGLPVHTIQGLFIK